MHIILQTSLVAARRLPGSLYTASWTNPGSRLLRRESWWLALCLSMFAAKKMYHRICRVPPALRGFRWQTIVLILPAYRNPRQIIGQALRLLSLLQSLLNLNLDIRNKVPHRPILSLLPQNGMHRGQSICRFILVMSIFIYVIYSADHYSTESLHRSTLVPKGSL